ncbi:MAG: hydrogenase/urease maturation nickel metallochaperone HypA [Candidatus Omnitrophica bacterium]|nr:hydrogenase/urease maturation nickel metallochaperone HypA [Candidatus Omnitrophota bacterium]MCM8828761.1 hydrogenase/urease maturation nickel metallochaperone HypA [Candidatus Omnitrophota bacterium]
MHEMSVVQNLVHLLRNICEREKAIKVVLIELTINHYSCLDEENLNFMFSSFMAEDPVLKDAKIKVKRSETMQEREYVVENVEIEVE